MGGNNTVTVIQEFGMGTTDVLTAQYFCSLIGVASVESTSIKKSNSIEGDVAEYGQKSISTQKRNLLNVDEILRIPSTKLLVNLRGNNPLLLDKMIYTEHPISKELKDSPITEYNPKWIKNNSMIIPETKKSDNNIREKEKLSWDTF